MMRHFCAVFLCGIVSVGAVQKRGREQERRSQTASWLQQSATEKTPAKTSWNPFRYLSSAKPKTPPKTSTPTEKTPTLTEKTPAKTSWNPLKRRTPAKTPLEECLGLIQKLGEVAESMLHKWEKDPSTMHADLVAIREAMKKDAVYNDEIKKYADKTDPTEPKTMFDYKCLRADIQATDACEKALNKDTETQLNGHIHQIETKREACEVMGDRGKLEEMLQPPEEASAATGKRGSSSSSSCC